MCDYKGVLAWESLRFPQLLWENMNTSNAFTSVGQDCPTQGPVSHLDDIHYQILQWAHQQIACSKCPIYTPASPWIIHVLIFLKAAYIGSNFCTEDISLEQIASRC